MSTTTIAMTLRLFVPAALVASFFYSCGTSTADQVAVIPGVERIVREVSITSGEPVTTADLSIEGMSCEMMCGGSIKKALAALGVTGTEIKMNEAEGPDHAIVTYDDGKITDVQMIEAIQKLHDGQYKVLAVSITKEVLGTSASNSDAEQKVEEEGVSVSVPEEVVLPSILAILSRIIRE